MKHLFYIHSNLTYLAALGTICKENLDDNDVLIITRYKLGADLPIPAYFLDLTRNYRKPWKAKWMFSPYKYIDKFINQHIGDESFVAYVDAMVFPAKLIVSNPRCKSFNFIEEGAGAHSTSIPIQYFLNDDISAMSAPLRYDNMKRKLYDVLTLMSGVSLKNLSLPYMPHSYYCASGVTFYGFGKDVFRGANCVKEISWEDIGKRFQFVKKYNLNNSAIWLGIPPQVENISIPLDNYSEALVTKCIPHMKKNGVNKVFVKHHPVASDEARLCEVDAFEKNGIEVTEMDDETLFEIEMFGCKNVTIYTVMTALVEYAYQMGVNKIYSIANYFPGYIKDQDFGLWKYVSLI